MFSIEALLVVGFVLFCVGAVVGAVVSRSLIPPEQQRDLEQRLQGVQQELEQYQHNVSQHFMETSARVGDLTQTYRDLHEHLAKGALQLTNPEISRKMLAAGDDQTALAADGVLDQAPFEPPKDWAPKMPGQRGTLSEEFGLNDELEDGTSGDEHPFRHAKKASEG